MIARAVPSLRPAVVAGVLVLTAGCGGREPEPDDHAAAVAVAEDNLAALASADVEALCETYGATSQQQAFATYDVDDCAGYAAAHVADPGSGYRVTRHLEADFEAGDAEGDGERVTVGFTGEVGYTGDVPEAIDYYEEHPTVSGAVVVRREDGAWRVDVAATEETF